MTSLDDWTPSGKRLRHGLRSVRTRLRRVTRAADAAQAPRDDRARETAWLGRRAVERSAKYRALPEPGLLSFLTPVWNTPPQYLRALAESIFRQNGDPPFEWVVLDNGSTDEATIAFLDRHLAPHPKVAFHRSVRNLGIVAGSRYCLERATGRYALLVDHDDRLYPDCACAVGEWLRSSGYPAAMYSDEDKLVGSDAVLPFLKPQWDPVLFVNQCYTAHLSIVERSVALELGAFTDTDAEGSPDWDCLMRLHLAGHDPVHLPEVLYSWRMHPASTALDMGSKDYIHSSQRAVVERYRRQLPRPEDFELGLSPLFPGTPDWRLRRVDRAPRPATLLLIGEGEQRDGCRLGAGKYPVSDVVSTSRSSSPGAALVLASAELADEALVALLDARVVVSEPDWIWETLGIFERYPDTGLVGGRLLDTSDRVVAAGHVLGFEPAIGCPDSGRPVTDPGYSVWLLKQRSVSAVSSAMCVFTVRFLRSLLAHGLPGSASWAGLGAWAGAFAAERGVRVVYTPFLTGRVGSGEYLQMAADERSQFLSAHRDSLSQDRWYSAGFGLTLATNYRPIEAEERQSQLRRLWSRDCAGELEECR